MTDYATGGLVHLAPVRYEVPAYVLPRAAAAHSRSAAAVLQALHGDLDMVRHEVAKLTDGERDELMRACAVVIGVAAPEYVDPAAVAHDRYRLALTRRGIGR